MITIDCPCGEKFEVDFTTGFDIFEKDGVVYHQWRCKNCGQHYHMKVKSPVILENNQ